MFKKKKKEKETANIFGLLKLKSNKADFSTVKQTKPKLKYKPQNGMMCEIHNNKRGREVQQEDG